MTIKGWVHRELVHENPMCATSVTEMMKSVYVEEIPSTAIMKELVVSKTGQTDKRMGMAYVYLPSHLIGRKCQIIIIPED